MFGRFGKIAAKLGFWFPPPPGHEDEAYLYVPDAPDHGANVAAAGKAEPAAHPPAGERGRRLVATQVLLMHANSGRDVNLALRDAGMKVVAEDDVLRAEKLLKRAKFDAVIVDLASMERTMLSFIRILRRSESKQAFLILLAEHAGPAEQEIADRFGADAVWPKSGLQANIVGNLEAVHADRAARASTQAGK